MAKFTSAFILSLFIVVFATSALAQNPQNQQNQLLNIDYDITPEAEILVATPAEVEKLAQDSEILHPNDYKEMIRAESQLFSSPQRGGGYAVWMMYRNRVSKKWELVARFDAISRYGIQDQSIGGGALLRIKKSLIRVEVSTSKSGGLLPDSTVELEYITPVSKKIVGYVTARRARYTGPEGNATNLMTSLAAEYYIAGNNMIYARVSHSKTRFDSGVSKVQPIAMVRFTHYIDDFDKVSVQVGNASESLLRQYDNVVSTARGGGIL